MPPDQTDPTVPVATTFVPPVAPPASSNTSGQGKSAIVPPEIRGWNWGAFGLSWIWGIGNSTWIALLAIVPIVQIVMIFVLGAKGNEWAWQNRYWKSVDDFKKAQRVWTIAWLIVLVIIVIFFGLLWTFMFQPLVSGTGGASYGADVARGFAQAAFDSEDTSAYVSNAYAPDSTLMSYDQSSRGAFEKLALSSFSVVDSESTLSGQVIFANDSEPICIVLDKFNGLWKVSEASQQCSQGTSGQDDDETMPGYH